MKRIIILSFVLLLKSALSMAGVPATAHSEDFRLSDEALLRDSPEVVTQGQALEDLASLKTLLQSAYGGYDYGNGWERLFSQDEKRLKKRKEWRLDSLFALVTEIANDSGVVDAHLTFAAHSPTMSLWAAPGFSPWKAFFSDSYVKKSGGKFYLVSRSSPTGSQELISVEGHSPKRYLFPTFIPGVSGQIFLLGSYGAEPSRQLQCVIKGNGESHRTIMLHRNRSRSSSNDGEQPPFDERSVAGVPVMTLRTLPMGRADRNGLFKLADQLRSEPVIVLDVRGLSGGDLRTGIRWLQMLTKATLHSRFIRKSLQSPIVYEGELNRWKLYLQQRWSADALRNIEDQNQESLKKYQQAETSSVGRWIEPPQDYPGLAPVSFSGTLIILTDNGVSEEGESFAAIARSFPRAIVMGGNTAGYNAFFPTNPYRLAHSGIEISFGSTANLDGDKTLEGKGVVPDVWLDSDNTLLDAVDYAQGVRRAAVSR